MNGFKLFFVSGSSCKNACSAYFIILKYLVVNLLHFCVLFIIILVFAFNNIWINISMKF